MLGAGTARAALHTHGLETGAGALGAPNYSSKAAEISTQSGVGTRRGLGTSTERRFPHPGTPALNVVRQPRRTVLRRTSHHVPPIYRHQHPQSDGCIVFSKNLLFQESSTTLRSPTSHSTWQGSEAGSGVEFWGLNEVDARKVRPSHFKPELPD